jgi:thiol-disulfide isomerase/thioredoxin
MVVRRHVSRFAIPLVLFAAHAGSFHLGLALAAEHPAPPFALRDLEGRNFRLSDYRGRPVVLDFWATWCGPCRTSMPHLDELQQRYRGEGLVVLGLSLDDYGPSTVRRYADRLKVRFRLAMASERVLDLYGPIRSVPTTIFINRRGEVVRRVVGYIDGETLETYARELF